MMDLGVRVCWNMGQTGLRDVEKLLKIPCICPNTHRNIKFLLISHNRLREKAIGLNKKVKKSFNILL